MAARNITKEFITRLIDNGKTAEGWGPTKTQVGVGAVVGTVLIWPGAILGGLAGWGGGKVDKLVTFRNKVRAGGDWDFKSNWLRGDQKDGVEVAGKAYRYDMPGNFHYGFVGTAAGISQGMLFSKAGEAQVAAGTSKPEYWCTDGDDPEDQEFIRLGIKLYDENGLNVTETNLKQVLSQFNMKVCGPNPDDD